MKCHYLANKCAIRTAREDSLCGTEESVHLNAKLKLLKHGVEKAQKVAYPGVSTGCCSDIMLLSLVPITWIGLEKNSSICCQLCFMWATVIYSVA